MLLSLFSAILGLVGGHGATTTVHTPHSVTSSVAFGERAGGQMEMVIISRDDARVMSSLDGGFNFAPVAGDGLGRRAAHRVVYYEAPGSGERQFVIGTDNGIWKYVPATGLVQEISTGLDAVDRYIADLAAPELGQDGPVVAINSQGQVYILDETTDTWTESIDFMRFDRNAVIAIAPEFDRNGSPGPDQTILVGTRGLLLSSTDGGASWANHPQFNVVAIDDADFHVNAIEFDQDYATSGLLLLGRGRHDASSPFDSEGELWRSTDFAANFSQVSVLGSTSLSSGVYSIEHAGLGPDAQDHWYASVYRFPEVEDFDAALDTIGVLRSTDGGQTWSDLDSFQEFMQEYSANERTAVALAYRRLMQLKTHPDFATNGELWLARAEGLYMTEDLGVHWEKRRFRPSTQTRDIVSGYNSLGQIITHGASYGSGLYTFNHATGEADSLIGEGVIYYGAVALSPNADLDGISMGGGQRDLMIHLDEPNPARNQGWYSVNQIRAAIDGDTGYVRTLVMPPSFGGKQVPGGSPVFAWSARFEDSALGETRLTLNGLNDVILINDVYNQPGQRAPYMHEMDIAASFDAQTLPRELDFFGISSAFDEIYRLLNTGTTGAPVFEWDLLPFAPEGTLIDAQSDPRFDRTNGVPAIWALTTEKLYRIEDLSADWSSTDIQEWGGIEDYLVVGMELSPDMDLEPAVYAATWGGGIFKFDLTQPSPSWEQIGGPPPGVWGECLALSPDFLNDRLIFLGTQRGLYYVEDRPGAQWVKINNEILYDSRNTSFDYYSPADPNNPDPTRPWGWGLLKDDVIPDNVLAKIDLFGGSVLFAEYTGDYGEFKVEAGSKISILSFKGPMMGEARITAWNAQTGSSSSPFHDVTVDLYKPSISNFELEVPLPAPGVYMVRVEASNLPTNKYLMIDGIRLTD